MRRLDALGDRLRALGGLLHGSGLLGGGGRLLGGDDRLGVVLLALGALAVAGRDGRVAVRAHAVVVAGVPVLLVAFRSGGPGLVSVEREKEVESLRRLVPRRRCASGRAGFRAMDVHYVIP